jgi:undecaprenyl diphosphate synthase
MDQPNNQLADSTAVQLPRNVAICPDGNTRWAAGRGLSAMEGHLAGGDVAFRRVRDARELGIEQLSLFGFSTENWTRSSDEIAGLMNVFAAAFDRGIVALAPLGIRLKVVGSRNGLPQNLLAAIDRAETATANNDQMDLFVAINYGGRQELINAAQQYTGGGEAAFRELLYAPGMRDPDLIIRTGGDRRLSNGFLWQAAYSELLFVDEPWPDFTRERLEAALADFGQRVRTLGTSHRQLSYPETMARSGVGRPG